MSKSLGVLTLDLIAKTSGFVEGLSKAERASDKASKKFNKDLDSLKTNIGLAAAAFAAGAAAMIGTSIQIADEAKKTAQAIGLTTEALTGLQWAASQSGVSNEELANSFKRFSVNINDAARGVGEGAEAFNALGISIRNTDGTIKSSEMLFNDVANALSGMEDGYQKTALAQDLLGKSGSKLIPLLNGGEAGIRALTKEAAALGLVIGDETAKNAEIFNDNISVLQAVLRGAANEAVKNFIPIMAEVSTSLAKNAIDNKTAASGGGVLVFSMKEIAGAAVSVAAGFEMIGDKIASELFLISQVPKGFDAVRAANKLIQEEFETTVKKYDEYLKRIEQIGKEQPTLPTPPTAASVGIVETEVSKATIKPIKESNAIEQEDYTDRLKFLEDSFKTELELLEAKQQEERDILAAARNQGLEATSSYYDLDVMLAQRHADQIKAMDDLARKEKLDAYKSMFGNLSTLMNSESRKAFEIGKAASYAQAVISGFESANLAYAGGLKVSGGNPAVGAAFAATAIAATAVQIQAIASTKFGGGGGGAGGGASNTQAVNNATTQVGSQQVAPDRNVFVRGINKGDLYSGEQLLDLINNELSNGGKIIANG